MGRFGPFAVGALVTGVLSVALAVVLVGPYGLEGVAVAMLVPTVLEALFFVGPFAIRRLGVDLRSLLEVALVPAVLPAVPCAALLLWATRTFDTSGWLALLATGAAGLAVYVAGYLAMPAAGTEREALARALRLSRR